MTSRTGLQSIFQIRIFRCRADYPVSDKAAEACLSVFAGSRITHYCKFQQPRIRKARNRRLCPQSRGFPWRMACGVCEPSSVGPPVGTGSCAREQVGVGGKCGASIRFELPLERPHRGQQCYGNSSYVHSLCEVARPVHRLYPPLSVRIRCHSAVAGRTLGELLFDDNQFAWEREVSKALLVKFLKARGVSTVAARRAVNKSTPFIAYLLSMLYANFQGHFRSGRELTTAEIIKVLQPYLESLALKYREGLIEVFLNFPDSSRSRSDAGSKQDAHAKFENHPYLLSNIVDGKLRPPLQYLLSLGLSNNEVDLIVKKFPAIVTYSVEGKLKPTVDVMISFGVDPSDIPKVITRRPPLLGCSVEDNLKPTMAYLESLGVDRARWPRMLVKFPHVLTFSRSKVQCLVDFLMEFGIGPPAVGKLLGRFPNVAGYSVEAKLRPIAEYMTHDLGVADLRSLLLRSPQVLGLSLEDNIKPTVEFLCSLGLTCEDVAIILPRFPQLLGLSISNNLQPKAELLVKMGRHWSELVDFPQYFGYSLGNRIKPRLEEVAESGLGWTLNRTLSPADGLYRRNLEKDKTALLLRAAALGQAVGVVSELIHEHVPE